MMFKTSGLRSISILSVLIPFNFLVKNALTATSSIKNSLYFLPPNQRERQSLVTVILNDVGETFCPIVRFAYRGQTRTSRGLSQKIPQLSACMSAHVGVLYGLTSKQPLTCSAQLGH